MTMISHALSPANMIHLKATSFSDGYVKVWRIIGDEFLSYTLVHESTVCYTTGSPYVKETNKKPLYYVQVRCGDLIGFISTYNSPELKPN